MAVAQLQPPLPSTDPQLQQSIPLADPADESIMVDYDPFQDAVVPPPVTDTEHAKDTHSPSTPSEPAHSPLTPPALGEEPIVKSHESEWECLPGAVIYGAAVHNDDPHAHDEDHRANAKLQGMHPDEYQRHHHESAAVCAICAAHEKGSAKPHKPHHDGALKHSFESLMEKVEKLEEELEVEIVHLVHEGKSWIKKSRHVQIGYEHPAAGGQRSAHDHELDLHRVDKVDDAKQGVPASSWERNAVVSPFY